MSTSKVAQRLAVGVSFALLILGAFAATASARATVGTFSNQDTVTFTDVSGCTGLTGTGTNTVTESGHYVDTGTTFHVSGTTTQDYRIDWSDGSYLISQSLSHFEFDTNSSVFVFTEAQQDRGTVYDAAGQVIGHVTVIGVTHTTWRDLNHNGQPDANEFTATVDRSRVSCP